MSQERDWNAEVIAEFRANNGEVVAPYDNPPPMLLLHTIGAKSGKQHIVPMRALPDGDVLYVFASAHGSARNPDWYYNLLANPDILIEMGSECTRPRDRADRGRARRDLRSTGSALRSLRGVSAKAQSNHPGDSPRLAGRMMGEH